MQRNEFRQRAELAKQKNVSRITVRRAVDDLVSQYFVEKKQGKDLHLPTEIREDIKISELFRNVPSYEYEAWGQMLENKLVLADDKIQKQNREPGSYVVYISRLRTADGNR